MAEVEISPSLDKVSPQINTSAEQAILETVGDAVVGYKEASFRSQLSEAADDVATLANEVRQSAESLREQGDPDPLMSATQARDQAIRNKELQVTEQARTRFERYQRAVAQGASNQSAARVAVQKEMRDMISRNPAFASKIREEAARAMGEEEFLVLSRDLPTQKAEQQSQFAKDMQQVVEVGRAKGASQGWTPYQTDAYVASLQRDVIRTYELGARTAAIEQEQLVAGTEARFVLDTYRQSATLSANAIMYQLQDLYENTPGGAALSPQNVQALRQQLDSAILGLRTQLDRQLAGNTSLSQAQKTEETNNALASLTKMYDLLQRDDAATIISNYKTLVDNGIDLSVAQALPLQYAAHRAFGADAKVMLDTLLRKDELSSAILRNSSLFADAQRIFPEGTENRENLMRAYMINGLSSTVEGISSGTVVTTPGSNVEKDAWAAIQPLSRLPVSARNQSAAYNTTIGALVESGSHLVPAKLAGQTGQLDDAQKKAVSLYAQDWERTTADLANELNKHTGQDGRDAFVRVVTGADGLPAVVIERVTTIREFDATGKATERLVVQPPVPYLPATEAYRRLYGQYATQRGKLAPIDNPFVRRQVFGSDAVDPTEQLNNKLYRLNGNRDSVEWLK